MKKLTSKILLFALSLLSFKRNVLAQLENPGVTTGLALRSLEDEINKVRVIIFLLYIPVTITMLFFYGSYFYFRNKQDNVKKEKAAKYLHRAKWFLAIDTILLVIFILLKVINNEWFFNFFNLLSN